MGMPVTYRLRVEYAKQDRGAYLSHLEVIRALERVIRRAALPYAISEGFSPHMKLSFGPALSVGTASVSEHFDVILNEFVAPAEALTRLQEASTGVLPILSCGYVSAREPSLSAAVNILTYQLTIDGIIDIDTDLPAMIEVVQKEKPKTYETALSLPRGIDVSTQEGKTVLEFSIRATPAGTLRPDSLVEYLLGEDAMRDHCIEYLRVNTWIESEDGTWREPSRP